MSKQTKRISRALLPLAAAVALAAWLGGCGPGSIYSDPRGSVVGSVSPRTQWRITGDLKDPQKAADDDVSTVALSHAVYSNAALTIDLGRPCLFNMVVIDHGPNRDGCAGRVAVLTSTDGREYVFRHAAPGSRRVSTLLMLTPVLARYIRLQVLQEGQAPWSVAEVYIQ